MSNISCANEYSKSFWFVGFDGQNLYLDFKNPPNSAEIKTNALLLSFLNSAIENSNYIKGLWKCREILGYIFEKKIPKDRSFIIGEDIISFSKEELESYPTIEISKDNSTVKSTFKKQNPKSSDKPLLLDIYLAKLWKSGVKYGYDFEAIKAGIDYSNGAGKLENPTLIVARQKDPIEGNDAMLEITTEKSQTDTRAEVADDGKDVDIYRFKNSIFNVKKGEILYKKIPKLEGKNGRDIQGHMVFPKKSEDKIDLSKYLGDGVELIITDGLQSIVCKKDGTLKIEKDGKLSVDEGIVVSNVDKNIGNLKVDMSDDIMRIEGDVEDARKISANVKELIIEGRVYAATIEIEGDTILRIKGGVIKSKIIHNGAGKIEILEKTTTSLIVAKDGEVDIKRAQNSTIVAKNLDIELLEHGSIIAKDLSIKEIVNISTGKAHLLADRLMLGTIKGGGELGVIASYYDKNAKIANEKIAKNSKILELKDKIEELRIELEEFEKLNREKISRHSKVTKALNDKKSDEESRGALFLEKKRLFTKVIQKCNQKREAIESANRELHTLLEEQKIDNEDMKNYYIEIESIEFEGEIFARCYKRDSSDLFGFDTKKLLNILSTKAIPNDKEGERFCRIFTPLEGTFAWNAHDNAI